MREFEGRHFPDQFLEKVSKTAQKQSFFFKFYPNNLKNQGTYHYRIFSLATVLVIKAVIPEGDVIKHTFKIKKVKYYQNWENITRK